MFIITYITAFTATDKVKSSHRSIRTSKTDVELLSALPSHYICEWWRRVRSQPYLYISGTARLAFGSAFSLWPQRPGRGWTGPSCRGSHGGRGREEEEERGGRMTDSTEEREGKWWDIWFLLKPFDRSFQNTAVRTEGSPRGSHCSSALHLFIKSHSQEHRLLSAASLPPSKLLPLKHGEVRTLRSARWTHPSWEEKLYVWVWMLMCIRVML